MKGDTDDSNKLIHQMLLTKETIIRSYRDSTKEHEKFCSPPNDSPKLKSGDTENIERTFVREAVHSIGSNAAKLACLCVVSLDVALTIPVLASENGGWWFLLALYLCLVVVVVPVACLELTLGKLFTRTASDLFSFLAPIAAGVGWLVNILWLWDTVNRNNYMQIVLNRLWTLVLFDEVPLCEEHSIYCYEYPPCPHIDSDVLSQRTVVFAGRCVEYRYQPRSDNYAHIKHRLLTTEMPRINVIRDFADHHINVTSIIVFCCLLALFARSRIFVLHQKSNVFIVLVLFSLIFNGFINFYTCENCHFYELDSNPSILWSPDLWFTALKTAFALFGVGKGSWTAIGMHSGFTNNLARMMAFTLLYCTMLIMLSFTVTVTNTESTTVVNMMKDSDELIRLLMTQFGKMTILRNLGLFLLFTALTMSQIFKHVLYCEIFHLQSFQLPISSRLNPMVTKSLRFLISLLKYTIFLFAGTLFVQMVDVPKEFTQIEANMVIITVVAEITILLCVYGLDRFLVNLKTLSGEQQSTAVSPSTLIVIRNYLRFVVPVPLVAFMGVSVLGSHMNSINLVSCTYLILVFLPVVPLISAITRKVVFLNPMYKSFRSTEMWGPSNIIHRRRMYRDERAGRINTNVDYNF